MSEITSAPHEGSVKEKEIKNVTNSTKNGSKNILLQKIEDNFDNVPEMEIIIKNIPLKTDSLNISPITSNSLHENCTELQEEDNKSIYFDGNKNKKSPSPTSKIDNTDADINITPVPIKLTNHQEKIISQITDEINETHLIIKNKLLQKENDKIMFSCREIEQEEEEIETEFEESIILEKLSNDLIDDELNETMKILLQKLKVEQQKNTILNELVINYIVTEDTEAIKIPEEENLTAEIINKAKKKFHEELEDLDLVLKRKNILKQALPKRVLELQQEHDKLKVILDENATDLNRMLMQVNGDTTKVSKIGKPQEGKVLTNMIENMNKLREQALETHAGYLKEQQKLAAIKKEIKKAEKINDNLRRTDYDYLKRETIDLCKEIEEKTFEIRKMKSKLDSDIKTMKNVTEKKNNLENQLYIRQNGLKQLLEEFSQSCDYLLELKNKQNSLQIILNKMNFNSGILGKNELLKDYDKTTVEIEDTEKSIENLKNLQSNYATKLIDTVKVLKILEKNDVQ